MPGKRRHREEEEPSVEDASARKRQRQDPDQVWKQFEIFKDSNYKDDRGRCLVCKMVCSARTIQPLKIHLAKCPGPGLRQPTTEETRSHFIIEDKDGFSKKRATCNHCDSEVQARYLIQHLMKCTGPDLQDTWYKVGTTSCHGCGTDVLNQEMPAHKLTCSGVKTYCPRCNKYLARGLLPKHLETCQLENWHCWHCNTSRIPLAEREEHKRTCSKFKCKHCFRVFPIGEKSEHQSNCQARTCQFCRVKMTKDEKEEHRRICEHRPCRHCGKRIPVNERESHEEHCEKWKCTRRCGTTTQRSERHAHSAVCTRWICCHCRENLPRSEREDHRQHCSSRKCLGCGQYMSKEAFELHNCGLWKCSRCKKNHLPLAEKAQHLETCHFHTCPACHTSKIPDDEFEDHKRTCQYRWCSRCNKGLIPVNMVEEHRISCSACHNCDDPNGSREEGHRCLLARCPNCQSRIKCDELPQHLLTCKIAICDICKRRFATAAALREHQTAGCLAQPQQPSSDSHGLSLGIWKSNRPRGFSLSIWKSKAPNNLSEGHSLDWLSANFPLTPGVHRVLKTWVDSPNTVAIGDFEYSVHFAKILKHQAVVEFSLANAKGEWIVPRTTINHGMAKGRYAALMRFTYDERRESNPALYGAEFGRAMMMIRKFYGQGDWTEETPGLTWAQIAQIIEEYIKKHGPLDLFLEWGTNNGDYQCLRDGLESVGKAHLLPPKPKWAERPYAWWSALRRRLGYSAADAPLGLGILYRAIFPEDAELANGWHNSDVDTMMTIKLIETYFIRALDQPIPGKIDSYFRPILPEDVESRLEDLNINECDDDEERCNEMFYQEMRDLDDELCKEEGEEGEQSEADEEADEEMTEDEGTDIEEEMSDREETS